MNEYMTMHTANFTPMKMAAQDDHNLLAKNLMPYPGTYADRLKSNGIDGE